MNGSWKTNLSTDGLDEGNEMNQSFANCRRELLLACLAVAFASGVIYDTRYIVPMEGLRSIVAAAVVACFGAVFVLMKYPSRVIQPAILSAWPLHLYTLCLFGVVWCYHGGAQKGQLIAYTLVGYATFLLIPLCLYMDRRLFDGFIKIVAVGCALLSIPSFIGALGIDSLGPIPLSNKYSYSGFSGIIASGGIFEHGEGHALQMAIGLFCCVYLYRKSGSLFYGFCALMALGGLIVSQGRGAIFGVMIAVAFWVLPEIFRRSRVAFVGGVAVCLLFPFLIWPLLTNIPGVSGYLRLERGLSGRDVAWLYAISLAEERPWTGHGFGTSAELSEDARKVLRQSGYSGAGTTFHNTFITKWVELGLIVTIAYSLIYIVSFWRICVPGDDVERRHLLRSIIVLSLTASIFRDYNIGGVRSTSILVGVFLGLASLWPLASLISEASLELAGRMGRRDSSAASATDRRLASIPGRSGS